MMKSKLGVQGPSMNIEKTYDLMNVLPTDPAKDRMMVEVHYYSPSQFCLLMDGDAVWGKMFHYWGTGIILPLSLTGMPPGAKKVM